jgi:hypothetical protein
VPPELFPTAVPGSVIPELLGPEALEGAGAWAKTTGANAPTDNASDPARNRAGNFLVLTFAFIQISLWLLIRSASYVPEMDRGS